MSERGGVARHRLGNRLEHVRGLGDVFLPAGQVRQQKQQFHRERRPARHRIVGDVARACDELFPIGGGVEECLRLVIPEARDDFVTELDGAIEPARFECERIEGNGGQSERRVILEEAGNLRHAFLVRAHHAPVLHECLEEKIAAAPRHVRKVIVHEHAGRLRNGAHHQAVPTREDLLVAPGAHASLTRLVQNAPGPVDRGAQLGQRDPVRFGERLRLMRHIEDVAPLEIALGRDAPVCGDEIRVLPEQRAKLGGVPHVVATLVSLAVGVERRVEAALR